MYIDAYCFHVSWYRAFVFFLVCVKLIYSEHLKWIKVGFRTTLMQGFDPPEMLTTVVCMLLHII